MCVCVCVWERERELSFLVKKSFNPLNKNRIVKEPERTRWLSWISHSPDMNLQRFLGGGLGLNPCNRDYDVNPGSWDSNPVKTQVGTLTQGHLIEITHLIARLDEVFDISSQKKFSKRQNDGYLLRNISQSECGPSQKAGGCMRNT